MTQMSRNLSLVSLVYNQTMEKLGENVKRSIELIKFEFERNIRKVVIKPNLNYYWSSAAGETTDVEVVSALIDVIRDTVSPETISIVESDATSMKTRFVYRMLGYERMALEKNVRLVNLSKEPSTEVDSKADKDQLLRKITIPRVISEADLFVSVPKLKLHSLTNLTCALKNQFGCISYERKHVFHPKIHDSIAIANKLARPNLVLVDGLVCKGDGPKRLNLLMAGTDPVAVDSVAARIAGLDPNNVQHIVRSEKLGVGSRKADVIGESWRKFADSFPQRSPWKDRKIRLALRLYDIYLRTLTIEGRSLELSGSSLWALGE